MSKPFKSNVIDVSREEALLHRQPVSRFQNNESYYGKDLVQISNEM